MATTSRRCATARERAARSAGSKGALIAFVRWLACVVAICAASPTWAAQWPERPVRLIVAAPAGSSIDALAREIAERLRERIGQPVVVENKAAAGGTVATAEVAKAAPDGYTLLLGFNGPLAFAPLLTKVPYDVAKDLAPVVIASSQPNVLAVNAELPARSVRELVALADVPRRSGLSAAASRRTAPESRSASSPSPPAASR